MHAKFLFLQFFMMKQLVSHFWKLATKTSTFETYCFALFHCDVLLHSLPVSNKDIGQDFIGFPFSVPLCCFDNYVSCIGYLSFILLVCNELYNIRDIVLNPFYSKPIFFQSFPEFFSNSLLEIFLDNFVPTSN